MLFNEDAVRAEDNYRRELLRDQNQKSGNVGKSVTVVLVAAALAVILTACGIPADNEGAGFESVQSVGNQILNTEPYGLPNLEALKEIHSFDLPEMGIPTATGAVIYPVVPGRITDLAPAGTPSVGAKAFNQNWELPEMFIPSVTATESLFDHQPSGPR